MSATSAIYRFENPFLIPVSGKNHPQPRVLYQRPGKVMVLHSILHSS